MGTALGDMVENVARKLGDPLLQFYTEEEIKQAIGESYRIYYMRLIREAEGFFETTTDLDIVSGVAEISLEGMDPPYKSISQVWRYVTNGVVPLEEQENRFNPVFTLAVGSGDSYIPQYKQQGTNLVLYPPPGASETDAIKFDYVYIPDFPVSNSSDDFEFDENFPTVYETNVECRAALKALGTKDVTGGLSDPNSLIAELAELDKAFQESFENDEYPDSVQYKGNNYRNGGYY